MGDFERTVREFKRTLTGGRQKTAPLDIMGKVTRVEDGGAWVRFAGSEIGDTPVRMNMDCKEGDDVQVRSSGGKAWIVGNQSAPPTDDTTATYARERASIAQGTAVEARGTAIDAQGTADDAKGTAIDAKETADSILIYDHDYTLETVGGHLIATFHAYLYQGGVDIHTSFEPEMFTWYMKTEDGTEYLGNGYSVEIDTTTCGYGAEVIGKFTTTDDTEALATDNSNLTNSSNEPYTVRSSGESIRVRDLSTSTAIYPSEKLMIVGAEDEHLVSIQTLQDYLNANLNKQVLFDTTANWNAQTTLVSNANTLYVYTDHQLDSQGNKVAGIKVGDGLAYVVDLPFTDAVTTEHIADNTRHVTQAERDSWNNKVRCYYAGTEQLIFTTA